MYIKSKNILDFNNIRVSIFQNTLKLETSIVNILKSHY